MPCEWKHHSWGHEVSSWCVSRAIFRRAVICYVCWSDGCGRGKFPWGAVGVLGKAIRSLSALFVSWRLPEFPIVLRYSKPNRESRQHEQQSDILTPQHVFLRFEDVHMDPTALRVLELTMQDAARETQLQVLWEQIRKARQTKTFMLIELGSRRPCLLHPGQNCSTHWEDTRSGACELSALVSAVVFALHFAMIAIRCNLMHSLRPWLCLYGSSP